MGFITFAENRSPESQSPENHIPTTLGWVFATIFPDQGIFFFNLSGVPNYYAKCGHAKRL